jgi:ubiquinone biosynthesis monooxygenase Coq7
VSLAVGGFKLSRMDALLIAADSALRTVFANHHANRLNPSHDQGFPSTHAIATAMTEAEKGEAAALMRVNHVGEVCAQALYTAQALATRDVALRQHLTEACNEETDHLAWTEERLKELGGRTSLLNPLWYVGAFGIGYAAAKLGGDRVSLGFVVETERQVEAHLQSHMHQLPEKDSASRAIVATMKADEARHAQEALAAGAAELPAPIKGLMKLAAKVMTTVAHRI